MGLFINTERDDNEVQNYFDKIRENIKTRNLPLLFENRPALFPITTGVVEWMFPEGFRKGKDNVFRYFIPKKSDTDH